MGSHLSGIDGHRGVLGANSDSHDEACPEQTLPSLGEGRSDRGGCQAGGCDKDFASTSEVVVERVDNEGTAIDC